MSKRSPGREAILAKVRGALGVAGTEGRRKDAVARRLEAGPRHLLPDRVAGKPPAELTKLFRGFLEGQSATVLEMTRDEVPAAISSFLRNANLPQRVRVGADPWLAALPWSKVPGLERASGRADPRDDVGLAHAVAGVAETGTMMLASGADNPVTVNFLPETHIVVIDEKDIVAGYEDGLAILKARLGPGVMPRTLNMISGPSRTGDIGGRIVMGAHGPRRMCVVIVKS